MEEVHYKPIELYQGLDTDSRLELIEQTAELGLDLLIGNPISKVEVMKWVGEKLLELGYNLG